LHGLFPQRRVRHGPVRRSRTMTGKVAQAVLPPCRVPTRAFPNGWTGAL
jgi:hypothetical protein